MDKLALVILICGLLAAFSWGVSDFLAAEVSKKFSPELAVLFTGIIGAVAYTLFYVIHPSDNAWTTVGLGFGVGTGISMGLGLLLFYRGLDIGPVSIVSPIGSAYPLVTTLIAVFLFGNKLSWVEIFAIFLIVLGIVVSSGLFGAKKSERKLTTGVLYAICTFIIWGVAFAFLGATVSAIGWEKATLVDIWAELAAFVVALPFLQSRQKFSFSRISFDILSNKFVLGAAVLQLFGLIIFNIGLTKSASSAVITAISASYPALTIFLALKHFGEKMTLLAIAGATTTVAGIVLLSL